MSKKKKEKVIYYDDNSTISDMSNVNGMYNRIIPTDTAKKFQNTQSKQKQPKIKSTAKEKWDTYISTVRLMFKPMLIVIGILCVLFLLFYLLGRLA